MARAPEGNLNVKLELCASHPAAGALCPLTFSWDAAVLEDIRAAGTQPDMSILKPELLSAIEKL